MDCGLVIYILELICHNADAGFVVSNFTDSDIFQTMSQLDKLDKQDLSDFVF